MGDTQSLSLSSQRMYRSVPSGVISWKRPGCGVGRVASAWHVLLAKEPNKACNWALAFVLYLIRLCVTSQHLLLMVQLVLLWPQLANYTRTVKLQPEVNVSFYGFPIFPECGESRNQTLISLGKISIGPDLSFKNIFHS